MFGILGLGFLLGMQHALEIDHLAAVSSIAARRDNVADIVKHGLTWGMGHTLTLFAFAGAFRNRCDGRRSCGQISELAYEGHFEGICRAGHRGSRHQSLRSRHPLALR